MVFSKTFPKTVEGSNYPTWEEVYLSDAEEEKAESLARQENLEVLRECVDDAKKVFVEKNLKEYQTDIINAAIALFEKRASHAVFFKEQIAKTKFDEEHK
ncbi:hypothetical protein GOV05_02250 [Candidatus Woesearchaeota archaeon]|nr:hypothetical protein [Candidatus Woesearchaeota archaeon]